MLTYHLFAILILCSILAPVAGAITLLFTLSFEREMDVLKIENKQVRLEKELQQSEYMQLNQQIQPHFLFNTMNLLLGLARLGKNDQLIETLEHLTKFLRFKYQLKEQLIPLKLELEYTQHYLAIQRVRFGDRLHVEIKVENTMIKEAQIPPYLLQTLTENAFKHGLERKIGSVQLTIQISMMGEVIVLEVTDNGAGLKEVPFSLSKTTGHGLKNIDKRLGLLFGEKHNLSLEPTDAGGTKVKTSWPLIYDYGDDSK